MTSPGDDRALIEALRKQGCAQALASISLPNDASIRLHEMVGFKRAGVYREAGWKHGRWVDVGLWQLQIADLPHPPPEPRGFGE